MTKQIKDEANEGFGNGQKPSDDEGMGNGQRPDPIIVKPVQKVGPRVQ